MSNPSQKYDPFLNKWAKCLRSDSIVQLRSITNKGKRIVEFYDGSVTTLQEDQLQVLEKCTGYDWKEEKSLIVGCKNLTRSELKIKCGGVDVGNVNPLANAFKLIRAYSSNLGAIPESLLFVDNRGHCHSVKFSDVEKFLAE